MDLFKFNDENYKTVWVVATTWERAYELLSSACPKFDVVQVERVAADTGSNTIIVDGSIVNG